MARKTGRKGRLVHVLPHEHELRRIALLAQPRALEYTLPPTKAEPLGDSPILQPVTVNEAAAVGVKSSIHDQSVPAWKMVVHARARRRVHQRAALQVREQAGHGQCRHRRDELPLRSGRPPRVATGTWKSGQSP